VQSELERLRAEGVDLQQEILPLLSLCETMRACVQDLDRTLNQRAKSIDICRRWMELPGVGPLTALSFYTAIDDPSRFEKNVDVGPYLGLVPRTWQSAAATRRGRISKRGDRLTRGQLVLAARIAMMPTRPETELKGWALEVKKRRGHSRAKVALARKLAVVMLAMWKSGESFRPFPEGGHSALMPELT
jgi:transposase